MGKQSSRIYFQGKDHKDIYFKGQYHTAMYKGNQLIWKKIFEHYVPVAGEVGKNRRHGIGKLDIDNKVADLQLWNQDDTSAIIGYPDRYHTKGNFFVSYNSGTFTSERPIYLFENENGIKRYILPFESDKDVFFSGHIGLSNNMIAINITVEGESSVEPYTKYYTVDDKMNVEECIIDDETINKSIVFGECDCETPVIVARLPIEDYKSDYVYYFYKNGVKIGEETIKYTKIKTSSGGTTRGIHLCTWGTFYADDNYLYSVDTYDVYDDALNEYFTRRWVKKFDFQTGNITTTMNNVVSGSYPDKPEYTIFVDGYFYQYNSKSYKKNSTTYYEVKIMRTKNFYDYELLATKNTEESIKIKDIETGEIIYQNIYNLVLYLKREGTIFCIKNSKVIKENGVCIPYMSINYKPRIEYWDNLLFDESEGNFYVSV